MFAQSFWALRLDGLERHPVNSRGSVVLFGHFVRFAQRLHLADVDVQTPETPGRFRLRLDVYPPPQVLQIDGRLCHLFLALPCVAVVTNCWTPSLTGLSSVSSTFHPLPHSSP